MDHAHIDDANLAERYVTGRLAADERADFEAHFVDCAECLDRIEAVEGLRRGFSALKPREQVRRSLAFFARQWQGMALALAAAVIVVLGIAMATTRSARSRAEADLEAARLATANLEKR